MSLHAVELTGCRVDVLAHYLKALGLFRLVSQQADANARAFWRDGIFVLVSRLTKEQLTDFFASSYRPTPLVAPWNGGSGFFPKDNKEALTSIKKAKTERLRTYQEVIAAAEQVVGDAKQSPKDEEKQGLIETARATWPTAVLPWLDAALSLSGDSVRYPALLGTGGNDGRLDFTNNFMQRVVELIDVKSGAATPASVPLLTHALFGVSTDLLQRGLAIGQFLPGAAGGANSESGFGGDSLINPWDFVFALEGAVAFQVTAVRKLDSAELPQAAAPFAVRSAGAGYASAAAVDESNRRGEQWMPVWTGPATWSAFALLLAEGRLLAGRARAGNAVDVALALSRTSVARGVSAFQRFGLIERNGQANLAVPLGLWPVTPRPTVTLVSSIERWVDAFKRAADDQGAPAGAARLARQVQTAILDVLSQPVQDRVEALLLLLAEAEDQLVRSSRWATDKRLRPLPWIEERALPRSGSPGETWEIARALAALRWKGHGLRNYTLPLDPRADDRFKTNASGLALGLEHVWTGDDLVENLCAAGQRRLLDWKDGDAPFDLPRFTVRRETIARFVRGELDERAIGRLTRALMCVKWETSATADSAEAPEPLHDLCRLAWSPPVDRTRKTEERPDRQVFKLLARGRGEAAVSAALRRLAAWGERSRLVADSHHVTLEPVRARRIAAALLMPLSLSDLRRLKKSLRRSEDPAA